MALDAMLQKTTISFHWKCPVTPDRPHHLNCVSNVKQGMDGDRAGTYMQWVLIVIEPRIEAKNN